MGDTFVISGVHKKRAEQGRDAINPYIAGCITYEFTFGKKERHETGFVYQLIGPGSYIFLDNPNKIPAGSLSLSQKWTAPGLTKPIRITPSSTISRARRVTPSRREARSAPAKIGLVAHAT